MVLSCPFAFWMLRCEEGQDGDNRLFLPCTSVHLTIEATGPGNHGVNLENSDLKPEKISLSFILGICYCNGKLRNARSPGVKTEEAAHRTKGMRGLSVARVLLSMPLKLDCAWATRASSTTAQSERLCSAVCSEKQS